MSFQNLMDELEVLAKSEAATDDGAEGDQKTTAAADEGVDAGAEGADAGADKIVDEGEGGDGQVMGKSMSVTLEDGTEVDVIDGTDLVKALMGRVEGIEGNLEKSLGMAVGVIKAQAAKLTATEEMVKSMQAKLDQISGEGRGRKTVLNISEKPSLLKKSEEPEGISVNEFMAKALTAQAAGKITGADVCRAEANLNRGLPIPADIVARVAQ